MPRYIEIDEKRLTNMHEGLELLEAVDRGSYGEVMRQLDLHLYGISTDASVLDAAREAIAEHEEAEETDVQVAEVAVAIPLSADTIWALTGSGIKLDREEFAYMGGGGEGVRSLAFMFARYKPTVTVHNFSQIALASSDSWIDDFLRQHGKGTPAKVVPAVHRTEEATQSGVPLPPQVSKQTSLLGGLKLSDVLDEFLS
jgi:hypothetical protein